MNTARSLYIVIGALAGAIAIKIMRDHMDAKSSSTETSEKKVRAKLTTAQFKRRRDGNELDGFPTNALVES